MKKRLQIQSYRPHPFEFQEWVDELSPYPYTNKGLEYARKSVSNLSLSRRSGKYRIVVIEEKVLEVIKSKKTVRKSIPTKQKDPNGKSK